MGLPQAGPLAPGEGSLRAGHGQGRVSAGSVPTARAPRVQARRARVRSAAGQGRARGCWLIGRAGACAPSATHAGASGGQRLSGLSHRLRGLQRDCVRPWNSLGRGWLDGGRGWGRSPRSICGRRGWRPLSSRAVPGQAPGRPPARHRPWRTAVPEGRDHGGTDGSREGWLTRRQPVGNPRPDGDPQAGRRQRPEPRRDRRAGRSWARGRIALGLDGMGRRGLCPWGLRLCWRLQVGLRQQVGIGQVWHDRTAAADGGPQRRPLALLQQPWPRRRLARTVTLQAPEG